MRKQKQPMPQPGKPIFLRWINEVATAYAAFKLYCEMGPGRNIRAVERKCGKSKAAVALWSKSYGWVERAIAWDSDQDEKRRKAQDEAMKADAEKWAKRQFEVREQSWAMSQALLKKANALLEFPLAKRVVEDDGKTVHIHPQKFSLSAASRMIEVADKLARLAAGVATEKIEHTGPDNQPIQGGGQVVILELPDNRRSKADDHE